MEFQLYFAKNMVPTVYMNTYGIGEEYKTYDLYPENMNCEKNGYVYFISVDSVNNAPF